jgi:hypothetical protein
MVKKHLSDALLVAGIAVFVVALPTVYGWYLSGRDLLWKPSMRSGQA